MHPNIMKTRRELISSHAKCAAIMLGAFAIAEPGQAQVSIGLNVGITNNAVCVGGGDSETLGVSNTDDCAAGSGFTASPFLQIGPDSSYALFIAATGESEFTGTAAFFNDVDFNGTTSFTDVVSFTGPNATFATPTFFTFPATFQAATTVNGALTTNGITNSGLITTGNFSSNTIFGNSATITNILGANGTFTNSLSVVGAANINMGGNQVHGVAAGTANTDAVNVAQLNAATSGITTDVTALQTITATHTTQIAAVEAVNTTQSSQIAAIQTVNTTQSTQISAIQAVNTTQSGQISALEAASSSLAGDIDTLFDLRRLDRRDMKQGIASAIAIAPAPMPSAPGKLSYAFNGATFRGEYAVGGSLMYRLPGDTPVAVNVGFSYAGNKNNGLRVGVAGEF